MPRRKKTIPGPMSDVAIADNLAKSHQLKAMDPELLGKRLRRVRSDKKISQRDLTGGLFTSAYLSSIELGKTRPTLETLDLLAGRLGETVEYFLRPAASQISKVPQADLDEEQFEWMSVKQHIFQCEVALAGVDYQQATLELEQVESDLPSLNLVDQALFHLLKGVVKNRQGEPDQALVELSQVKLLKEGEQAAEPENELLVRFDLETGRAYRTQGNYVKALDLFHKTLKATGNKASYWQRELLIEAGETSQIVGEFEFAADYLEQGLAWFSPDNQKVLAQTLLGLAHKQAGIGDFQQAAFLLGQSREVAHKAGEISQRQDLALRASHLYFQLGRYDKARQAALLVDSLASESQSDGEGQLNEFSALVILAKISSQEKDFEAAHAFLNRAEQLLEQAPKMDPLEMSRYYQTFAQFYANSNQQEKAPEFYLKAITLLEPLYTQGGENQETIKPVLSEMYYEYSQLLKALGELERTMDYLEKAYRLRSF